MSKYLVAWVDQFWENKKDGTVELLEKRRRTQITDDFEPTREGIRKFAQSQKVGDRERGLYWSAVVLSFSKLEE